MFDRPLLLWLLVAAPLMAAPGLIAARNGKIAAGLGASALRVLSFVALVFALVGFGFNAKTPAKRVEVIALVDRSRSIAPDQAVWIRREVRDVAAALSPKDRLGVVVFGRNPRLAAPLGDPRLLSLAGTEPDRGATDIATALSAASSLFSPEAEKRIVLLSDGDQTVGDAMKEAPAMLEEGVRVYPIVTPPTSTERVALSSFEGPSAVWADRRFAFRLSIESEAPGPVDVALELQRNTKPLGRETVTLHPGLNHFALPYRMDAPGAYLMNVRLRAPAPLVALNSEIETPLTVKPRPAVLLVATAPSQSIMRALSVRHYKVVVTSPRSLPTDARDYLPYQAVIISDASAATLSAPVQAALGRYVGDFGGGRIATGETLRDDHFAGSTLEKILPTKFKPQPPPPTREPIAVYLLIDRSNSMSYDSRYPAVRDHQRIRYAKAAAIALLRQLDDTDYAGVIAFDSQPYVLSHLQPLGTDRKELENRIERLEPGGGTDFKEALEIAEREILASGIPVHMVILLTDGDTNRPYHDHDQLIRDYAREHIPVSTIRIGPDLANLRLLQDFAHATGGTFYRVQDIEKLPLLMVGLTREAMNRRDHLRTRLLPGTSSEILNGIDPAKIPPIDYYALATPKEGAQVPLSVARGETPSTPLLAAWQYGLGRSAILAIDPDSLASLSWIRWDRYAEFWSQLVAWTMRQGDPGPFTVKVTTSPEGGTRFEAEKVDNSPTPSLSVRVSGPGRVMDVAMTQVGASVYRADLGPLPRGTYTATLMTKAGDTESVLLQRKFASAGAASPDAAELRIRPPDIDLMRRIASATGGTLNAAPATIARATGAMVTVRKSAEPYLLPLAIFFFLGEVFVRRRLLGD